jgi:hypothetical protein
MRMEAGGVGGGAWTASICGFYPMCACLPRPPLDGIFTGLSPISLCGWPVTFSPSQGLPTAPLAWIKGPRDGISLAMPAGLRQEAPGSPHAGLARLQAAEPCEPKQDPLPLRAERASERWPRAFQPPD